MQIKFFLIFLVGFCFSSDNLEASSVLRAGLNEESLSGKMKTMSFSLKKDESAVLVNYEIHYNESQKAFAQRVRSILEYVTVPLIDYFKFTPQDSIHFIIKSDADSSNGSATPFPRNLIELYDYPPLGKGQLSANPNWIEALVLHELIHAFHLDRTTGFLQGLRTIFGSIGKMGGLTPRWFSEGLATWGESYFTGRGRRLSFNIYDEVMEAITRVGFCQSADCVDFPSDYPGGAYSYYVGSHFLNYLEEKKPGTLQCLVEANSDSVIFFLNSAFNECVGKDADEAFKTYLVFEKTRIEQKQISVNANLLSVKKLDLSGEAPFLYSKGTASYDGKFYVLNTKRSVEKLLQINDMGMIENKYSFPEVVSQIGEQTINDGKISEEVPVSIGPTNKTWVIFNLSKGKITKLLSFDKNVHYLLLFRDKFVKLLYSKNTWKILLEDKLVWTSPEFFQLNSPSLESRAEKLYLHFKSYQPSVDGGQYSFSYFDFQTQNVESNFNSRQNFETLGSCENYIILRQNENVLAKNKWNNEQFNLTGFFQNALLYKHSGEIHFTRQFSLVRSLYVEKTSCVNLLQKYKSSESELKEVSSTEKFKQGLIEEKSQESYPSLRHFAPKYWIVNYAGAEEDSVLSISTSINDPKSFHQMALDASWYTELDKFAPSISYTFSPGSFAGDLYFSQAYNKSTIGNQVDEYKKQGTLLTYSFEGDYWSYIPGIKGEDVKTKDFISDRKYQRAGIVNQLLRTRTLADSFWQNFGLYTHHFYQETQQRTDFFGQEYLMNSKQAINLDWQFLVRATYGKYQKKETGSGVLYGGTGSLVGENTGNGQSLHSFYGLNYREAFGNEIFTSRFQFDINMWRAFMGPRIFPTYLREVHFLLGADYLKTDFLIYKNRSIRAREAHSFHSGLKVSTVLLYVAPLDFDFIFARAYLPGNLESDSFLFLASSFF